MLARILSVANEDKGKYNVLNISFRHLGTGKTTGAKVLSFTYPDVCAQLKNAEVDSVWDVVSEKNEKGFWEWTQVSRSKESEGALSEAEVTKRPAAAKANSAGRDFESGSERALRQVLIVRQSSIGYAIQYLENTPHSDNGKLEDVLDLAAKIEAWVFRGKAAQKKLSEGVKTIAEMDDDIPY